MSGRSKIYKDGPHVLHNDQFDSNAERHRMVALNPGPVPKPQKRIKEPSRGLQRGGKKPKEAGRRYEQRVRDKFHEPPLVIVKRQVGSGAFGKVDPMLLADLLIDIGRLKLAAEVKSWATVDGRGEKTITVPASVLYKLDLEAKTMNRDPIGIFHMKNSEEEWCFIRMSWFVEKLKDYEGTIIALEQQLQEAILVA